MTGLGPKAERLLCDAEQASGHFWRLALRQVLERGGNQPSGRHRLSPDGTDRG